MVQTQGSHLRGLRILVAEDAPDIQTLITFILEADGASVELVSNGRDAVSSALEKDFDVVLMDIHMPVLDGYEAVQLLREQGFSKPIIALTASALKEERLKSLKAGCNDHLTKPFARRELIGTLAQHAAHCF